MDKGNRQKTRYCSRWGGLNGAEFVARTSVIRGRLTNVRRFVREGLVREVCEIGSVISIGHEIDQDRLTLIHIRSELDSSIAELNIERAKVDQAIVRVNASAG